MDRQAFSPPPVLSACLSFTIGVQRGLHVRTPLPARFYHTNVRATSLPETTVGASYHHSFLLAYLPAFSRGSITDSVLPGRHLVVLV